MTDARRATRRHPAARRIHGLALVLGTLFGLYFVLYGAAILMHPGPYRFGDFFAIWSYGKVVAAHPAAELYNFATLVARQEALGMPATQTNPFAYPPSFLPVVWPLGLLSYNLAYVAFMGVTFALYLFAVGLAATPPRLALALTALVAPTSILTLVAGQSGFLAAALFLGGIGLAPARPVLGGVLLGLLAYKPQLGLLVPVALVAAGMWRTIAAAILTVSVVALATSALFGWDVWADWIAYLPAYAAQFARESAGNDYLMPTLTAALRALGVAPAIVRPGQAALALAAAIWVWRSFRSAPSGARAILVLATASFLATPHAFVYDLPMLTGAALLFVGERVRRAAGFTIVEIVVLILALCFPAIMVQAGQGSVIGVASLAVLAATLIAHPSAAQPALQSSTM